MASLPPRTRALNSRSQPRKRKRPSARAIKIHRSYTVDDAARAVGASKGTIRRWLKGGLPALEDQRPVLILGGDLCDFLQHRKATKQKCQIDECYCFKCRTPRKPTLGMVDYLTMTPTNGNLRAICCVCGTLIHKRISLANLPDLQGLLEVTIMQRDKHLIDSGQACPDEHFTKEAQSDA